MNPRTIVSVLDASSTASDVVLSRALSLADAYGAVLHVVQASGTPHDDGDDDGIRRALLERIDRVADTSRIARADVVPAVLATGGVRAIADYADRVAADLVVIGKGEGRPYGYWSAGAFLSALGKAVKAPTLTIPADAEKSGAAGSLFSRVLVAVDFSEVSERALSAALVMAQQSGGHLTVLHALEFPYEAVYSGSRAFRLIDDLRSRVSSANRALRALIPADASHWAEIEVATVSGRPHQAILSAASERRADVIVLGLPKRPRLEDFLVGSTVHGVLRRTATPVLLVPDAARASSASTAAERTAVSGRGDGAWHPAPVAPRKTDGVRQFVRT